MNSSTTLKHLFQLSSYVLSLTFIVMLLLPSCYSIRIATKEGTAEPANNEEKGWYRDKKFMVVDTTVNLSVIQDEATIFKPCSSGGFYSVEYRVTLGMVLLSGITFGKVRKVKVKCVCLKESN